MADPLRVTDQSWESSRPRLPDQPRATHPHRLDALRLGHVAGFPGLPVHLRADRVNRHTFCGGRDPAQRAHAVSALVERALVGTSLSLVVLDLDGSLSGIEPPAAQAGGSGSDPREVLHLHPDSVHRPLRIRFADLPVRSRAALLGLDPATDRTELNALVHVWSEGRALELGTLAPALRDLGTAGALRLAERVDLLTLPEWQTVWAAEEPAVTDALATAPAGVLDLAGYPGREQRLTVALGVLDHLLARRDDGGQVLVVLHGADHLCPPDTTSPVERAVRNRVVQLALEGHRHGLWLVVSAPAPADVHRGVLSRCTNALLTPTVTEADLTELGAALPHLPLDMLTRAEHLGAGEALAAGPFVHRDVVVTLRDRPQATTMRRGRD